MGFGVSDLYLYLGLMVLGVKGTKYSVPPRYAMDRDRENTAYLESAYLGVHEPYKYKGYVPINQEIVENI